MRVPIVVMGVSGCGKSTVAAALAARLHVPFADADDLHTIDNIAAMAAGHPLDDDSRRPWLAAVGTWLSEHSDGGVIACSALRRRYRDQLREYCPQTQFLHLAGSFELIAHRLADRRGHFMPPTLLQSQFDALEPLGADENGVTVDVNMPVNQIVDECLSRLRGI
ncbi:gluconokinase [Mycobacterium sp. MAA66]|uniref:gluconokinase n=1 Tax=Mycobacterium sp. MAA66 TaxID=3156297 RepID=UPI0035155D6A